MFACLFDGKTGRVFSVASPSFPLSEYPCRVRANFASSSSGDDVDDDDHRGALAEGGEGLKGLRARGGVGDEIGCRAAAQQSQPVLAGRPGRPGRPIEGPRLGPAEGLAPLADAPAPRARPGQAPPAGGRGLHGLHTQAPAALPFASVIGASPHVAIKQVEHGAV